jgi:ribonucleoside-diphosphate reductase alpha chain
MLTDTAITKSKNGLLPTPPLPKDIPSIEITENARQVLVRRYVRRGALGEPIESVEEMFWRGDHVAAIEDAWNQDVIDRTTQFLNCWLKRSFSLIHLPLQVLGLYSGSWQLVLCSHFR